MFLFVFDIGFAVYAGIQMPREELNQVLNNSVKVLNNTNNSTMLLCAYFIVKAIENMTEKIK